MPGGAPGFRRLLPHIGAYLFLLPFLFFFGLFRVYPVLSGFYISLFKRDILGLELEFVGLGNYAHMLSDPIFRQAATNTIWFTILTAPSLVVLALALAIAVNGSSRSATVARAVFFAPRLLSVTVVSVVWLWILSPQWGLLNYYLVRLGLSPQTWLADVRWAIVIIAIAYVWYWVGFDMIVFVAGLQQVPVELYEAASLDGAGRWVLFRKITIPGLRRPLLFVCVNQVISSFQVFALVYIITGGGPVGSTRVLVQYVYESGFRHYAMGYASAIAYVLFAVILLFTLLQLKLMRAWDQ